MIIVSQDKDKIINFDNITQFYINFDEGADYVSIIVGTVNNLHEDLGKYKTEERAKEVLEEIIKIIDGRGKIEMTQANLTFETSSNLYYMPLD